MTFIAPEHAVAHRSSKLLPIAELLERLGIGQRLDVAHRQAVHDVAHRELDDLVALGARNVRHLHDLRRHVPRRGVGADVLLDPVDERRIEREAVLQAHEQDHAHVAHLARRPILADDEAFDDLGQLLDLAIDLRRADAHAAGIERRIGAAVEDEAAVRGQLRRSRRGTRRRESARSRWRGTWRRRDRSRIRSASTGTAPCRRARP